MQGIKVLKEDIIVDDNGHLMGALGVAILSLKNESDKIYSWDMENISFETKIINKIVKIAVNKVAIITNGKPIKYW